MTRKTIGVPCCPVYDLPSEAKSSANELVGDNQDLS